MAAEAQLFRPPGLVQDDFFSVLPASFFLLIPLWRYGKYCPFSVKCFGLPGVAGEFFFIINDFSGKIHGLGVMRRLARRMFHDGGCLCGAGAGKRREGLFLPEFLWYTKKRKGSLFCGFFPNRAGEKYLPLGRTFFAFVEILMRSERDLRDRRPLPVSEW